VAIRLAENNQAVLNYLLMPSTSFLGRRWLWISEASRAARKIERFDTFEELARSLVLRVNKATRVALTKRRQSTALVSIKVL
jgi:hypothetical protein